MVFYVTFLRALAACLITNAHYEGIYPVNFLANGGLLGDVLFFSISGYCLASPKLSFLPWYLKRIRRIYPTVILITLVYTFLGAYNITPDRPLSWWFLYPTYYHFISSIIILYIPFYFITSKKYLLFKIPIIISVVFFLHCITYIFCFDKSIYHIDNVHSPMILFLFFECMLLGAYFRINHIQIHEYKRCRLYIGTTLLALLYITSKMAFGKFHFLSEWQIINQLILFLLLFGCFLVFISLEEHLDKIPNSIKTAINFIAKLTLEIYLVQYVIIDTLKKLYFFPFNWVLITGAIILSAYCLHEADKYLARWIENLFKYIKY